MIGGAVNEAARLTELAKDQPGRLRACETIVSRAQHTEAEHWRYTQTLTLRGHATPARLAVPF